MKQNNVIPKLRFREFSGAWEEYKFKDIADKIKDGTHFSPKTYKEGEFKYLTSKNVKNGYIDFSNLEFISKEDHEKIYASSDVKYGDVLLTKDGTIGQCCINILHEEFSLLSSVAFIRPKSNFSNYFIYQLLVSDRGQQEIKKVIAGQALKRITLTKINDFKFSFPSLVEQEKIATYLSALDVKINLLSAKEKELLRYKKAMMQKLFAQEIRFKDDEGKEFEVWEEVQLKDILFEHKEKNKGNKYSEVFSVAKEKGVINQIEHLGRSYAAENIEHYKVINPFDVVYTKSPTSGFPFGIIKQNKLNRSGVLSPLYAVFRPKTKYIGMLLHDIFLSEVETYNYLVPLVQKGAKNTMNINNEDFLKGKTFMFPSSIAEQKKIADFLSAIDKKINKVQEQINHMQSFKKAMLQQMFV